MINYKVSDLIKHAKSMADLKNSNFISHADNIHLINDAYIDLYQKSIDAGEKYWLVETEITNGENLPDDFFQLLSVVDSNGHQIPLRTQSEINSGLCAYEIKNGKFYLYQKDKVCIQYYPQPKTLTYPFDKYKLGINTEIFGSFLLGHKDKLYSKKGEYDLEQRKFTAYDQATDKNIIGISNDFIFFSNDELEIDVYSRQTLSLWDTLTFTSDEVLIYIDTFDVAKLDITNGKIYDVITGDLIIEADGDVPEGVNYYDRQTNSLYSLNADYITYIDDDYIYGMTDNRVVKFDKETKAKVEVAKNMLFGCVIDCNEITGNGIYYNDWIFSHYEDTELNYPSNLFYSALSYRLASDYKIKQNEDATDLQVKTEEAMYTYFDTIQQDIGENVRIRNVYY